MNSVSRRSFRIIGWSAVPVCSSRLCIRQSCTVGLAVCLPTSSCLRLVSVLVGFRFMFPSPRPRRHSHRVPVDKLHSIHNPRASVVVWDYLTPIWVLRSTCLASLCGAAVKRCCQAWNVLAVAGSNFVVAFDLTRVL